MTFLRYILLHGLLFLGLLPSAKSQVQSGWIDSLERSYQTRTRYYYVKPMAGLTKNRPDIESARFSQPSPDFVRHHTAGLLVGYRSEKFGIETGLTTLSLSAGYTFRFLDSPFIESVGLTHSVGYTYVPLTIRYRVWEPKKRLSVHMAAGAGLGWSDGIRLNNGRHVSETYFANADGVKHITRTTDESTYRNRFWTSTIGVSGEYSLSKDFSVDLQLTKFLSPKNIISLNTTVEPFNESISHTTHVTGGANGLALMLSVSYRFGIQKRYKLIE